MSFVEHDAIAVTFSPAETRRDVIEGWTHRAVVARRSFSSCAVLLGTVR